MYFLYDKISIVVYRIKTLFKNKLIRYYLILPSVAEGSQHEQSFICKIILNTKSSWGRRKLESRKEQKCYYSFSYEFIKGAFADMWHAKRKC